MENTLCASSKPSCERTVTWKTQLFPLLRSVPSSEGVRREKEDVGIAEGSGVAVKKWPEQQRVRKWSRWRLSFEFKQSEINLTKKQKEMEEGTTENLRNIINKGRRSKNSQTKFSATYKAFLENLHPFSREKEWLLCDLPHSCSISDLRTTKQKLRLDENEGEQMGLLEPSQSV